jgi:hypothetical protein
VIVNMHGRTTIKIDFATDTVSRRNESGRGANLSSVRSSKCRVVSRYFRVYPKTDGMKDGRACDFVNEIIKEQSIDMLPP